MIVIIKDFIFKDRFKKEISILINLIVLEKNRVDVNKILVQIVKKVYIEQNFIIHNPVNSVI